MNKQTNSWSTQSEDLFRTLPTDRRSLLKGMAAFGVAGSAVGVAAADPAGAWSVSSPDGGLKATVLQNGQGERLSLMIRRNGTTVLESSPLGITTAAEEFTDGLEFTGRTDETETGQYQIPYGKRSTNRYRANVATLTFASAEGSRLDLDVRAANEGVSYRYRLPGSGAVDVLEENGGFRLPSGADAFVHPWTNNYENEYRREVVTEMNGEYGFPTLFNSGDDWILLTEADVDGRYCASRLETEDGSDRFDLRFPPGETVTAERPLETPWRVAIVGELDAVVESDLVLDVSPPSKLEDTSWIRPGRAAWSWWSDSDSPSDFERQKEFVNYASKQGWEFVLVDDQWDADWVPGLVEYADERSVDIILWTPWDGVNTEEERNDKLPRWKSWGVAGIKVDFMDSDQQDMMQFYDDILEATAANELMINFHGSTLPKGRRRRWPHLVTSEAVYGAEQYWGPISPSHNVILPYTRNVVGPMDYTPVTFSAGPRETTVGHELALSVVYESGHQHFADAPEEYANRPIAERFLRAVAAGWDETRFVDGFPGSEATIARRAGDHWFVGSITAGESRTIDIPLSFLRSKRPYVAEIVCDDETGEGFDRKWREVRGGETITCDVQENGGVAVHLTPAHAVEPVVETGDTTTIKAGESSDISVTLTNYARSAVTGIEFQANSSNFDVEPVTDGYSRTLTSSESTTATWNVTAPEDAAPGRYDINVDVSYKANGDPDARTVHPVVEVPLNPLPDEWETFASTDASFGSNAQNDTVVIDANGGEMYIDRDPYGALYRPSDQTEEVAEAVVRVVSQEDTDEWAKSGLMLRNDITGAGESTGYACVMVTPSNGFALQWDGNETGYLSNSTNAGNSSYPCWLRLEKDGSTVTGSYSTDGATWTEIGSADVPGMEAVQDIGLFTCSQNESRLCRTEFDRFQVAESLPSAELTTDQDIAEAGETIEITCEFTNTTGEPLQDIEASLDGPEDWTVTATSETSFGELAAGDSVPATWVTTVPGSADSGEYDLTATYTYSSAGASQTTSAVHTLTVPPAPPADETYLSDHEWLFARTDWGSVERDQANNGSDLEIGEKTYEKGLGTHATSEIRYYLGGTMSQFVSDVGIDNYVEDEGNVKFRVLGDNEILTETDTLTGEDDAVSLDVDVSAVDVLELIVTEGTDGTINNDHANWADAHVLE